MAFKTPMDRVISVDLPYAASPKGQTTLNDADKGVVRNSRGVVYELFLGNVIQAFVSVHLEITGCDIPALDGD